MNLAASAVVLGEVSAAADAYAAPGAVLRATAGAITVGAGSAILETCAVIGATSIGSRTVFGDRCAVVGATIGDLCEIGNGSLIMPGARLGNRVFTGEGTLVPPGAVIADDTVLVGRPGRAIRRANDDDLKRLRELRDGDLTVPPAVSLAPVSRTGGPMGSIYAFNGRTPTVAPTAVLLDSAELTGDIVVGEHTIIGAGVKILGDSHGPVRIGADVQILENTVLHLLPHNELVIEDAVTIGPACMIHGCHIGAGSVVEPGAIVCDFSRLGAGSLVRAGAVVKQRSEFGDLAVVDGFPAKQVDTLATQPERPPWAFAPGTVSTLLRP